MTNFDIKDMYNLCVQFSDGNRINVVAICFSKAVQCAHLVSDKEIVSISKVSFVNVLI